MKTIPSWQSDKSLPKWQNKVWEITEKLQKVEQQQLSLANQIRHAEQDLISTRSAVILEEADPQEVTQRETILADLRHQQNATATEVQALKAALSRAEAEVREAESEAKKEASELAIPLYREKLLALKATMQAGEAANNDLMEFENHIGKQGLREQNRLLRKTYALHGISFPDGIRAWEKLIEPLMKEEEE